MINHPTFVELSAEVRRNELLQEAEYARLQQTARNLNAAENPNLSMIVQVLSNFAPKVPNHAGNRPVSSSLASAEVKPAI